MANLEESEEKQAECENERKNVRTHVETSATDSFDEEDEELVAFARKSHADAKRLEIRARLGIQDGDDSFDEC